jgi:hypothetical protein
MDLDEDPLVRQLRNGEITFKDYKASSSASRQPNLQSLSAHASPVNNANLSEELNRIGRVKQRGTLQGTQTREQWKNRRESLVMEKSKMTTGEIGFRRRRLVDGVAQWVKIPHNTEPHQLFNFMALTRQKGWSLVPPSLIISVTGSAQEIYLRKRFYDSISRAIVLVAKKMNAWIVGGGTEAGVMKLVGDMKVNYDSLETPVIGIATYGAVTARNTIRTGTYHNTRAQSSQGSMASSNFSGSSTSSGKMTEEKNQNGAFLDPNHSHFVLVDTGKTIEQDGGDVWGGEVEFRERFEVRAV